MDEQLFGAQVFLECVELLQDAEAEGVVELCHDLLVQVELEFAELIQQGDWPKQVLRYALIRIQLVLQNLQHAIVKVGPWLA